jgi:hypothetical protein
LRKRDHEDDGLVEHDNLFDHLDRVIRFVI